MTIFHKKRLTLAAAPTLAVIALVATHLFLRPVSAAPSANPDPYADAVESTQAVVVDANNALGAPNGTSASLAGVGASVTLDMGSGEEGTETLKVYVGQLNAQVNINVTFLDSNKAVILSTDRQLGADANPSVQNFAYDWHNFGKTYRYVRISSTAGAGVSVDAVEALGYVGSTAAQDTDGDGTPDRAEQEKGTNTLDAKSKPPASALGASAQVNNPPAKSSDTDGDGIPNDWETKYGLNPNDASDAQKDADGDGMTNKQEYGLGSDPTKADTDGDGMPDKWEFEHGTDILKYDAENDPDGDYLTNLGEFKNNTDPQKADDLTKVFCKDQAVPAKPKATRSNTPWLGIVLAFVVGLLGGWLVSMKKSAKVKPGSGPVQPPIEPANVQ